jgi:hypothetical protein
MHGGRGDPADGRWSKQSSDKIRKKADLVKRTEICSKAQAKESRPVDKEAKGWSKEEKLGDEMKQLEGKIMI